VKVLLAVLAYLWDVFLACIFMGMIWFFLWWLPTTEFDRIVQRLDRIESEVRR
jgi:hypothetical protein